MTLAGGMIATGRFCGFVESLLKWHKDEGEEKALWELWLHKVYDKSYSEFKKSLGMKETNAAPQRNEQIKTVQKSYAILNGFCPVEGASNGDIQTAGYNRD